MKPLGTPKGVPYAWGRCVASVMCAVLIAVAPAIAGGRVVSLASVDGTPLAGTFYESSSQPSPGVVLVHMLGRQRDDWAPVAERLQQQGLAALTIDLRGHGASGGAATPLPRMAQDVRAAVQWLASRAGVRPDRIGIAGASLGASFALQVAVEQSNVRSIVLLSPSLDYRGVRIDSALVHKYGARPVLLIASSDDPYALRSVRELASDTSGIREQRLASVVAHGTGLLAADSDLAPAMVDWFRRTLIF
jgi:dienelactone hydrolase